MLIVSLQDGTHTSTAALSGFRYTFPQLAFSQIEIVTIPAAEQRAISSEIFHATLM